METETGLNCDGILRNQLVSQRGASTSERINVVLSQIQSRHAECAPEVWDPQAIDLPDSQCFLTGKNYYATSSQPNWN